MLPITEWLLVSYALVSTLSLIVIVWFYQKKDKDQSRNAEAHQQALRSKEAEMRVLQLRDVKAMLWEEELQELKPQFLQCQEENKHLGKENATLTTEKTGLIRQLEEYQLRYANEVAELKAQHEKTLQESKKEVSTLWDEKIKNHLTQTLKTSAQEDEDRRTLAFKQQNAPLQKMIEDYKQEIDKLGKQYNDAVAVIDYNVKDLSNRCEQVTSVMRTNKGTGNWGELQLDFILELAGLQHGLNYEKQTTLTDGKIPDVVVNLTSKRFMVIDSKTLQVSNEMKEATIIDIKTNNTTESETAEVLTENIDTLKADALVKALEKAVKDLASKVKSYTRDHSNLTPDFIILFLPKESMFSVAMATDPKLWERAWTQKIVISSPLTLIPLLKMVNLGWQQQNISANTAGVLKLGKDLHEKMILLYERFEKLENHYRLLGNDIEDFKKPAFTGKGNLVTIINKLEQLGTKGSKKLPDSANEILFQAYEENNESLETEVPEPIALPALSMASNTQLNH